MKTNRLEAFSDGVLAIIITIMVMQLKVPEEATFQSLLPVLPVFFSYAISFIFLGIYWLHHHHLFQVCEKVNGKTLWANLHLLFWLSLIPYTTSWVGNHHIEATPVMLYGVVLLMSAIAYNILLVTILNHHEKDFALREILGNRKKEKVSMGIYTVGITSSYYLPFVGIICYILVALMWVIPDQRIEKKI